MPKKTTEEIQLEFLRAIPEDGDEISVPEARSKINTLLKRNITPDEFAEAQKSLIANHKLSRRRRGIRTVLSKHPNGSEVQEPSITLSQRERDMEEPVENFLHRHFVPDIIDPIPKTTEYLVHNTARHGPATGLWTRPDLTLITVTRYPFQPVPELELYGFELKCADGCTVYAVHEALAHTAFVHYSTLVVQLPDDHPFERNLDRMKEQAIEHGIGIIRLPKLSRTRRIRNRHRSQAQVSSHLGGKRFHRNAFSNREERTAVGLVASVTAKIISIANMKGGVGKTTLTVSLADGLAHSRRCKVLVVDLDFQLNSSQVLWGVRGSIFPWDNNKHIAHYLINYDSNTKYILQDRIIQKNIISRDEAHQPGGRISLLSSSPELRLTERLLLSKITPLEKCEAFFHEVFDAITNEVIEKYDVVIIDCPPGISLLAEVALKRSDMILVPVAPSRLASEGIKSFDKFLNLMSLSNKSWTFLSRMTPTKLSKSFRIGIRKKYRTLDNEYREMVDFANAMELDPKKKMTQKYAGVINQVVALSNEVADKINIGDSI